MQIIHHITMDLARGLPQLPLDAVQGDGNTRKILLTLLEDGKTWNVPEGVTAAVAFRKADGKKGLYDTLPHGAKAVTFAGNTVTALLAPQVLTCPGEVSAAVVFYNSALDQLATFPFAIRVKANPAAGQEISNDYYRYSTMEQVSEAVEAALASLEAEKQEFLSKAEEALQVVHNTATEDAPAIVCEATGEIISVADASNRVLHGLSLYGKTTQNGTPTPENPVPLVSAGESGNIGLKIGGKNRLSDRMADWSVSGLYLVFDANSLRKTVTISLTDRGNSADISGVWFGITDSFEKPSGKYYWAVSDGEINFSKWSSKFRYAFMYPFTEEVFNKLFARFKIQFEFGEATEYEQYKETQTLTASTLGGLCGIPVSSGGNYTDENGQAWICDEIDFARGVYVQRCIVGDGSKLRLHNEENNCNRYYGEIFSSPVLGELEMSRGVGMCNFTNVAGWSTTDKVHYFYAGTGVNIWLPKTLDIETIKSSIVFIGVLQTPIETPLSAEELAAYAALHTAKPNTTVFNDGGAGLKLTYNADTKLYIDQKISAISAAMLNA